VRGEQGGEIVARGTADDSEGYFVRRTIVVADDPDHEVFTTEYFGPILGVFIYEDAEYDKALRESAAIGAYGLTGSLGRGCRSRTLGSSHDQSLLRRRHRVDSAADRGCDRRVG
jgi:acyl-CoA reductase-like NAD-dependent aldehyde dehydrogenase